MENEQEQPKEEAVVEQEQPVVEEAVVEEPQESVEELKQRLANAKAENIRKTQELQKLREQTDSRNAPAKQKFDPTDLSTWNDIELIC
jgi:cell division protein FtsB